jgi:hypothetical protein
VRKRVRRKWHSLPKLIAMMSGIIVLAGIVLLGIAVLGFFGYFDISLLLQNRYLSIFATAIVVIGLLDVLSAIIIARW